MSSTLKKKYEPDWRSLSRYEVPEWFMDAKLGIFIHWGVYAVPAFGDEWYPRNMYRQGTPEYEHHRQTWGQQSRFGYKDFIPMFKGEKWDPESWVDLFIKAGAKYIVPVAEHHDGFAMYGSDFTRWNAVNMGPKRDIVAELSKVVRRRGLKFGVSTHRAFNWRYYTFAENFDTIDPQYADLYSPAHSETELASQEFIDNWMGRTRELIDRFQPDLLWFDIGWHRDEFEPYRPVVVAYYYNQAVDWGKEVVLNYKKTIPDGVAVYDVERGKLDELRPYYWQTDTAVSYKSWGYIEDDQFKTVTTLVHDLVDIVSKNGNLLLNVGPRADGIIAKESADLLLGVGEWLKINGEAIYGTRHWEIFGEGPTHVEVGHITEHKNVPFTPEDIRFTRDGSVLYAILLGWPGKEVVIHSLHSSSDVPAERIGRIQMLGSPQVLSWSQDPNGLTVHLPAEKPCQHAFTLKIDLKA
jgi:alpha-L-fucosidase